MKEISLTRGKVALVDDDDYEHISQYKWHVSSSGYARRNVPHPTKYGKRTLLLMHRAIMGLSHDDKREVDHIDGNRLNNCRANLRICSHSENARNKSPYAHSTVGLKGVTKKGGGERWKAQIMLNGRRKHLGYFATPEEAHAAYRKAAAELHGEFARLE
ncbi:HNH endonuclease [Burkholderia multivorans]|uniref:HNH endonuclease n=1 Tax=Burkholderia multivorans TaxID=87883 RepID=UPI00195546F8|nr:HNH endonuclease [Burkholderia multivorans]